MFFSFSKAIIIKTFLFFFFPLSYSKVPIIERKSEKQTGEENKKRKVVSLLYTKFKL